MALDLNSPFLKDNGLQAVFHHDDLMMAIYNIAPVVPGHCLIAPVRCVAAVSDLTDAEAQALVPFARRVTEALVPLFHAEGFDWIIQDGESAGQTVQHMHLHLIPRHKDDFPHPGDWYPQFIDYQHENIDSAQRPKLSHEQMNQIVNQLTAAFTIQ